jgi:Predicted nucleotide-binding protein containing TIR-like domain
LNKVVDRIRVRPWAQPERLSVKPMEKPRIFLGSSGKQQKLLQALTRGLEDVARVEPWTTSFNPGTTTLERLLELTREVDFAAFGFAQDDWTTNPSASPTPPAGQASPRDNVVFEAGFFGGVLGMRRTFGGLRTSAAQESRGCPILRARFLLWRAKRGEYLSLTFGFWPLSSCPRLGAKSRPPD